MSRDIVEKFDADPFILFDQWFDEAKTKEINDPNAVYVATSDADGMPSVRTVLLKAHDHHGFVFYTNCNSIKGHALQDNPKAEMLFHWKSLERQIRIAGAVETVDDEEADAYFATRHPDSQIGAWASIQSRPIEHRDDLKKREAQYREKFKGVEAIPRPPHWTGFRVIPKRMEFWIAGEFRLHTRFVYERRNGGVAWQINWLYP